MKTVVSVILMLALISKVIAQTASDPIIRILGEVLDKSTKEPLAYATISVVGRSEQAYSQSNGGFILSVPARASNDTLVVSYVGYTSFRHRIADLQQTVHVLLEQYVTVLPELVVASRKIDLRFVDRNARLIRGSLYAMNCEVTNIEYNYFLNYLQERHLDESFHTCDFDLSNYTKAAADFYALYHHTGPSSRKHRRDTLMGGYGDYPAVNISHAGAVEFCDWLTDQYNENPKMKKFKKVKFRLPTRKEWQIMALGEPKFQSWNIMENNVECIVPPDSLMMVIDHGKRITIPVTDRVLYPWFKAYYYRDSATNSKGCYLGNFRVDFAAPCPAKVPGYDGFIIQGRVGSYFPNNMGFYDVVGNVAEMIDEDGIVMGGSWKDFPRECTLLSSKKNSGPDESVGFRVFMDVIEGPPQSHKDSKKH